MFIHYIITSSSYSKGTRIAIHNLIEPNATADKYNSIIEKIISVCGEDVSISTHAMTTSDKTWESIQKNDPFFEDVLLVENLDEFIKLIKLDRTIIGLDVAKYIISKINCTHLKLQKMVYLCYANYLCETKEPLFEDKILVYTYGPVIESVYKHYKTDTKEDNTKIFSLPDLEMPNKSRILFAENGLAKISSIDKTIEKYKNYTASQLVDLTHKNNSPWSKALKQQKETISQSLILEFHKNEI